MDIIVQYIGCNSHKYTSVYLKLNTVHDFWSLATQFLLSLPLSPAHTHTMWVTKIDTDIPPY